METGSHEDSWGPKFNRNIGTILEDGISGVVEINVTDGGVDLSSSPEEFPPRNAVIRVIGTPTSSVDVAVPEVNKHYLVDNLTSEEVRIVSGALEPFVCVPESLSRVNIMPEVGEVEGVSITDVVDSVISLTTREALYDLTGFAPINSPSFTGNPRAPKPEDGDESERVVTTEYVLRNAIHKGFILEWWGETEDIPQGWQLCDGKNGTPDLRGRMVLGASKDSQLNEVGGFLDSTLVEHTHTTGVQDTKHTHTGTTTSAGAHSHGGVMGNPYYGGDDSSRNLDPGKSGSTSSAGAHTHSLSVNSNSQGHTHPVSKSGVDPKNKNLPPYKALHYIMKV